ncbi:hypothetical protein GCM10009530_07770 [Microbispora corallina]|uniref:Uncharacterized protein n=1 Tax=Microbispora corallina TaxID=83302 RepID=A0ABQ4FV86_9ACTN|nr:MULTISPECIES: hypothetical protein [Microbispora]ETK34163.1 hypothetical protein MPTA5024_20660 [Microbispora sp. ATCC PTA-5024]GIH38740.1 hypothetical protein Mco01_17400 [Microbispora corallina]
MGPELHYQFVINRAAELQQEAASHRRVREAQAARKAQQQSGNRRLRAAFGKLRTS